MIAHRRIGFTVLLLMALAACRGSQTSASPPAAASGSGAKPAGTASSFELALRDHANSAPSVAAFGQRIAVVWTATSDSKSDVYLSLSTDNGVSFGPPVRVNDIAGEVRASGEQPARVVVHKTTLHVVWPARIDGHPVIRYARSDDDGRTFTNAETVGGDGRMGARGWEAMALGYDGSVQVVWLDGRNDTAAQHHHQMGPQTKTPAKEVAKTAAAASARGPRQDVFHASWKLNAPRAERPVAADVCFCCKTAIATSGDRVYVAFRNLYPGGVRDIAIARSTDLGVTFEKPSRLSEDNWKIDACPDDGPAMAADSHGLIHIAWPTLVAGDTPRKGIFYSSMAESGAFSERLRLDSGDTDPAHPQIGSDDHGNTVVVWDERAAGARRIVLRRVSSSGVPQAPETFAGDGVTYPVAAAADDYWIVLWAAQRGADGSVIEGRRLPFHESH
jgi:hypothetical protein